MRSINLFNLSLGTAFLLSIPFPKVYADPVSVTINGTTYQVSSQEQTNSYANDLAIFSDQPWWGDNDLSVSFATAVKVQLPLTPTNTSLGALFFTSSSSSSNSNFNYWVNNAVRTTWGEGNTGYNFYDSNTSSPSYDSNRYYYAYIAQSDDGDATYSITGQTYAGKTLTAGVSANDPDGNGSVSSYTWQSSSDGSNWSNINGATSSTFTVTSSEEGKYIRVTVAYTDGEGTSESVTSSSITVSQLHTEWVQPYAAMQNLGLASMKNHRGLVLAKAGECNNYGWQVGDTDYCIYTNAKNIISYVNSSSTKGGYDTATFNAALNIEKNINNKWKAGVSYGYGSANLDNFNFSDTTANFKSYNSHYYLYGVRKANDKFTLKATFGGSDFDYYGYRNYGTYSSTIANSYYDADAFSGEINGIWNYKKYLDNSNNPIRLRPTAGIAYAIHNQDELSETGTGDLISIEKNQSESLLLKTGINIDRQIPMEKGKWILIPSFGINLEYDPAADGENTKGVKGKLIESSTADIHVNAENFGVVNAVAKLGADIVCTKDLMFSLNASIGVTNKGDQRSYGGGFRWHF